MTDTTAEIETGVFRDIPFADYLEMEGLHKTDLHVMLTQTPAHYHWCVTHPDETDTSAKKFGRILHTLVLEPDNFNARFILAPETGPDGAAWNRRYKAHKEAWAEWLASIGDREGIDEADQARAMAMVEKIQEHPMAHEVLDGAETELSLRWTDRTTMMPCKARLDIYKGRVVADLKTCKTADPTRFPRDAYRYGYWFQAAFYLMGCRAVGLQADTFAIIAAESNPPHCVAVYELSPEDLDMGRSQVASVLQQVAHWTKEGRWPGYSEDIMELPAPSYAGLELLSRID